MKAIVKDNHLNYNGINYFRVGSEDVYMGAYGEKKSPIFQGNYLSVEDGLPVPKLKVKEAVEVEIDFQKTTEKNFLANINVAKIFGASADSAYDEMNDGKLHLVKLTIDENDLERAINDSPKHREEIRKIGNDARIAGDIFVVLDSSETKTFTSATAFDISVNAGLVKVSAKNGSSSSGTTSVSVSNGSVFAYGLFKVKKWNKDKTRVEDLEDDQWGPV